MTVEQLITGVMNATPSVRRKVEKVLLGIRDEDQKTKTRETKLVTITGAAKALDVCRNTVLSLIRTGRLDTVDLNGHRRVTWASLQELLDGKRPANEKTAEVIEERKRRQAVKKEAR